MKWFQHDSDASHDAKIKKLLMRHGAEGYAVYFHCLELIAGDISTKNITFELEHDSEIIADNLKFKGKSGIERVNKIMLSIIELGLFTCENNRIFCFKLAQRLDNTIGRNPEINTIKAHIPENYKAPTKLLRSSNNAEEIRREEKRLNQKKSEEIKELFEKLYNDYPRKLGHEDALKHFTTQYKSSKDVNKFKVDIEKALINYKAICINKGTETDYILHASTFFNKRWKDFVDYSDKKPVEKVEEKPTKTIFDNKEKASEVEDLRKNKDRIEQIKKDLEGSLKNK